MKRSYASAETAKLTGAIYAAHGTGHYQTDSARSARTAAVSTRQACRLAPGEMTAGDSSRWMFLLPAGVLLARATLLSVNVYLWRRGTRNLK